MRLLHNRGRGGGKVLGRKKEGRASLEKMLAWRPEKVIMAHGRPYYRDGTAELRRAFRWLGSKG